MTSKDMISIWYFPFENVNGMRNGLSAKNVRRAIMKCFVSREYNINSIILNQIQEVLDELKIQYFDIYSQDYGAYISSGIVKLISSADIVIGVITGNSSNVLYEIGVAVGMGKAVFLLLDASEEIPSDLYNLTYIKINDNLRENLMLPLKFFVDKKRKKPQIDYTKYYKKGLENEFTSKDIYLERAKYIRESKDGAGFERLVSDLFAEIKDQYTTVKFQQIQKDEEYDFAVWVDELFGKIVNPIKFELKLGDMSLGRIEALVNRLARQIKNQELIIILCCGKVENYLNANSNVLVIEFEDFLDKIEKYGLAHAIWYYRCLGAHGRSCE